MTDLGLDPHKVRRLAVAALDRLRAERPDVYAAIDDPNDPVAHLRCWRLPNDRIAVAVQSSAPGEALVLATVPRAALLPDIAH